ncbi:MAG: hypothetical protein R2784_13195 [Saprospiraceae bacterium]
MKHLFYLNKFFVKYRWRLIAGVVFIITNYFRALQPQYIREALDFVIEKVKFDGGTAEISSSGF